MSEIVAARRLRKSLLKEINDETIDINNNLGIDTNRFSVFDNKKVFESNAKKIKNERIKKTNFYKNKLLIKCFFSLLIIFISLLCKLCFKEQVLANKYSCCIIDEYKKDYSKEKILEKIEDLSKKSYENLKYIIPEQIALIIQDKYSNIVKPYIKDFNLIVETKKIVNIVSNKELSKNVNSMQINLEKENVEILIENDEALVGKGGGEPLIAEATLQEEASAVSMMEDDIGKILNKNINIISPLTGVITSTYGAREQIFEGVNPYHTGIDVAAKRGTVINSSTAGRVKKIKNNDKYYGNFVIIETDGVNFKYAHMDEIYVKVDQQILQGDSIGTVGNTGMSTGPHLHFEISIDGRTIDPQNLVKF